MGRRVSEFSRDKVIITCFAQLSLRLTLPHFLSPPTFLSLSGDSALNRNCTDGVRITCASDARTLATPGYHENANSKVANEIAKCKGKLSVYDFALFPHNPRLPPPPRWIEIIV